MNVASAVVMLLSILSKLCHIPRSCPSLRRLGRLVPSCKLGASRCFLGLLPAGHFRMAHSRFLHSRRRRMVRGSSAAPIVALFFVVVVL